jgi:hypothetical protein
MADGKFIRSSRGGAAKAFSGEVDTGSREENALNRKVEPVPIQSEQKWL